MCYMKNPVYQSTLHRFSSDGPWQAGVNPEIWSRMDTFWSTVHTLHTWSTTKKKKKSTNQTKLKSTNKIKLTKIFFHRNRNSFNQGSQYRIRYCFNLVRDTIYLDTDQYRCTILELPLYIYICSLVKAPISY